LIHVDLFDPLYLSTTLLNPYLDDLEPKIEDTEIYMMITPQLNVPKGMVRYINKVSDIKIPSWIKEGR